MSSARKASPTIVLLHGSGDDAHVWDALVACLPQYTAIALDLPGHGSLTSRPGPAIMSVDDYAGAVRAEMARRAIEHVCLVGHSLGSAIALRMAVDYPALVSRLLLVGGGARLRVLPALLAEAKATPDSAKWQLVEMAFAPAHQQQAREFFEQRTPTAPGMLHRDLAACDAFDMMSELGHIAQPTLVVTGEEDRLTPPKYARFLAEHLDNARLVLIPNAGHYAQIEAPEAIAEAMRDWLG
ncbi:MAG TPA: alpha/beta hydrolase [Ktedonobacterales bacterium]